MHSCLSEISCRSSASWRWCCSLWDSICFSKASFIWVADATSSFAFSFSASCDKKSCSGNQQTSINYWQRQSIVQRSDKEHANHVTKAPEHTDTNILSKKKNHQRNTKGTHVYGPNLTPFLTTQIQAFKSQLTRFTAPRVSNARGSHPWHSK